MAKRTAIEELCSSLAEGEQRSGVICPYCLGGRKRERSFSLTRSAGVVSYICHRASCGTKGRKAVSYIDAKGGVPPKDSGYSKYKNAALTLRDIPEKVRDFLKENYFYDPIDIARLTPRWSDQLRRLWMPIFSAKGEHVGGVLRSISGELPKAVTILNHFESPAMAVYKNHVTQWNNIIVVEDQLSAVRAANTASSVALLGTNFNLLTARAIADLDPKHVVICLDADAFKHALEIQAKWGGMFDRCTVAKPPKDIKDMTKKESQEFIKGLFQ